MLPGRMEKLKAAPYAGNQCVVQSARAHGVACAPRRPGTLLRLWYCVAPDRIFVQLAMSEVNDQREGTAWFEKVTDGDYGQPTASAK